METKTLTININSDQLKDVRYYSIPQDCQDDVLKLVEKVKEDESNREQLIEYLNNLDFEGRCNLYEITGPNDDESDVTITVEDENGDSVFDDTICIQDVGTWEFFSEDADGKVEVNFPENAEEDNKWLLSKMVAGGDSAWDLNLDSRHIFLGLYGISNYYESQDQMWFRHIADGSGTITFEIEIPAEDDFDIEKLTFIPMVRIPFPISENEQEFIVNCNVIIYDGKFYSGECGDGYFDGEEYCVLKPIDNQIL